MILEEFKMKKARLRFSLWVMLMLLILAFTACQDSDDDDDDDDNGDTTAPTVTGTLTFSSVTSESLTLSWTAAEDDVTEQSELQYRVYRSVTNNIDTVAKIENNGTAMTAYTTALISHDVSNLENADKFYYNVIVKDAADNKTVYTMNIADTTLPVPGASGALTVLNTDSSGDSLTVTWIEALDDLSDTADLQYLVCNSISDTLSTVSAVETAQAASTATCIDYATYDSTTDGTISKTVTGLNTTTKYYFNVVVKDEENNKTVYTAKSVATGLDGVTYLPAKVMATAQTALYTATSVFSNDSAIITQPKGNQFGFFSIWDMNGNGEASGDFSNTDQVTYVSSTLLTNGNVLVAYNNTTTNEGNFVVYDSTGNDKNLDEAYNIDGQIKYTSAITLSGGNILIAYKDDDASGDFRIYDASGDNPEGDEITFNPANTAYIAAAPLTTGGALIAYQDSGYSGKLDIINSLGFELSSITFNDATTDYISAATLASGKVFIAYRDSDTSGDFFIYDPVDDSTSDIDTFHSGADTTHISVVALSNGDALVAFRDGDDGYGRYVVYNSFGKLVLSERLFFNGSSTENISSAVFSNNKVIISFYHNAFLQPGYFTIIE